jgi:hypothetical protein
MGPNLTNEGPKIRKGYQSMLIPNETMRYRLYTESINRDRLAELFADIEGYTVLSGVGVYKGKEERAVVYEVVSNTRGMLSVLQNIARIIREENKQETVLVTRESVESWLF